MCVWKQSWQDSLTGVSKETQCFPGSYCGCHGTDAIYEVSVLSLHLVHPNFASPSHLPSSCDVFSAITANNLREEWPGEGQWQQGPPHVPPAGIPHSVLPAAPLAEAQGSPDLPARMLRRTRRAHPAPVHALIPLPRAEGEVCPSVKSPAAWPDTQTRKLCHAKVTQIVFSTSQGEDTDGRVVYVGS